MVYSPPHNPIHMPHLQLFLDAMRRTLPPYGVGVGICVSEQSTYRYDGDRLGVPLITTVIYVPIRSVLGEGDELEM